MKITKGKLELKVPPSKYLQTIVEEIRENLQRMGVSQLPRILDAELVTMLARNSSRSDALSSSHATIGWLTTSLLVPPLARQAMLRAALRSLCNE